MAISNSTQQQQDMSAASQPHGFAGKGFSKHCAEIEDLAACADSQIKAALAIIDAVCVLSALERAPEHHDTHPSHNIKTGGGFAHGRKLHNDTLPVLLEQAHFLVSSADNDYDVMREKALGPLKGGAA